MIIQEKKKKRRKNRRRKEKERRKKEKKRTNEERPGVVVWKGAFVAFGAAPQDAVLDVVQRELEASDIISGFGDTE